MRGSHSSGCCWQASSDHLKQSQRVSHVLSTAPDGDAGVAAAEGIIVLARIYTPSFTAADLGTPTA